MIKLFIHRRTLLIIITALSSITTACNQTPSQTKSSNTVNENTPSAYTLAANKQVRETIAAQANAFVNNDGREFCRQITPNSKRILFKESLLEGNLSGNIIKKYHRNSQLTLNKYCPQMAQTFIANAKQYDPRLTPYYRFIASESQSNNSEVRLTGSDKKAQLFLPLVRITDNNKILKNKAKKYSLKLRNINGRWLSENCYLTFKTKSLLN